MTLGPIMVDLAGTTLDAGDRDLLRHPAVGGVILFARNYRSPEQLAGLTAAIHALRDPPLLIGVDQEGGRVQRFREGFTRLPPAGRLGRLHAQDPAAALAAAESIAWLMAAELRACGVDFSFAPVLDLDRGLNAVVGDRAFGADAQTVAELGEAWTRGVRAAGMAAVGKHFPGHGGVTADSHTDLPRDGRDLADLLAADLRPFRRLIAAGLEAVMPAHVIYPRLAPEPAGFSTFWLQEVLRSQLGFEGIVFSDDLNMAAAAAGGDYVERARAAARAGCDMLLICNNRPAALAIVAAFEAPVEPAAAGRLAAMRGRPGPALADLRGLPRWQEGLRQVQGLAEPAAGARARAQTDPTRMENRS
jgi:beta-N-acetylhexosaminidase